MKRRTVSDFLSAIPERTARAQTGSLFELPGAEGEHAAKIAHVAQYLNWLSPLYVLTRDDQVALGLVGTSARAVVHDDDDELEGEQEARAGMLPEPAVL